MHIPSLQPQKTLTEQVYEQILDAICNGALSSGARVTQDDLAERLQVSRQPVMTAVGQLRQQGFLVEHGRRGLQVAPVDRSRFDAIYELRSALEPLAASLAAMRATDPQLARGRALVEHGRATVEMSDAKASLLADLAFHEWIYDISGNPLLVESMHANWLHLRRAMGEVLRHPELVRVVWDEHAAIVEALQARNADLAAELIKAHVTTAHERVGALLKR